MGKLFSAYKRFLPEPSDFSEMRPSDRFNVYGYATNSKNLTLKIIFIVSVPNIAKLRLFYSLGSSFTFRS